MNILIFSKTGDYRHESTEEAKLAMVDLCMEYLWEYQLTEDSSLFNDRYLQGFDVVVFLLTSGNILDVAQKESLIRFVRSGKGLVTIHSGSFTEMTWPWWRKSVCAVFTGHPPEQEGNLIIEDHEHLATRHLLDSVWQVTDEFYSFDANPRGCAHILISVDEDSYDVDDNQWFPEVNQRMGDHPLVWCKEFEGGRIFHSGLGHNAAIYLDQKHRKLLAGALLWAAGKDKQGVRN